MHCYGAYIFGMSCMLNDGRARSTFITKRALALSLLANAFMGVEQVHMRQHSIVIWRHDTLTTQSPFCPRRALCSDL